jgi:hypothetical protein
MGWEVGNPLRCFYYIFALFSSLFIETLLYFDGADYR